MRKIHKIALLLTLLSLQSQSLKACPANIPVAEITRQNNLNNLAIGGQIQNQGRFNIGANNYRIILATFEYIGGPAPMNNTLGLSINNNGILDINNCNVNNGLCVCDRTWMDAGVSTVRARFTLKKT